jgi:hypothetical protein
MRAAGCCLIGTFTNMRADQTERLDIIRTEGDDTLQIEFTERNARAMVSLDRDEAERLYGLLTDLLAGNERYEKFVGNDEIILSVRYNNWGDPYDEGARFEVAGGGYEVTVDLVERDLRDLHTLMTKLGLEAAPTPTPEM